MATLNDLKSPAEYAATSKFYPTAAAVLWTVRCHKPRLVQSGAVVKVRGRLHINPAVFEEQMLRVVTEEQASGRALS